jgi:hypothetical protein
VFWAYLRLLPRFCVRLDITLGGVHKKEAVPTVFQGVRLQNVWGCAAIFYRFFERADQFFVMIVVLDGGRRGTAGGVCFFRRSVLHL